MGSYSKAFLVLDLQNDLCHQDGVYQKHGLGSSQIATILPNIINNITFCQTHKIPVIATQLSILTGLEKEAVGLGTLKKLRPFLENEGFRENTWGHDLFEDLPAVNYKIKKWSICAFFQTELDHYLNALGIKELILCGFTTNGVVETVAREAVGRNYKIITLTDCVNSYSESLHQASLSNLSAYGKIFNTKEWQNHIEESLEKK